jgi:hypothetical protein
LLSFATIALLMAACGGVKQAPPAEPVKSAPETQAAAPAGQPPNAAAPSRSAPPPSGAPPSAAPPNTAPPSPPIAAAPPAPQPAERPAPPSTPSGEIAAKAPAPVAKTPPRAAPPAPPVAKKEPAPPETAKPQEPPLDLPSLEKRLKETNAIGVMTKLTLKNQVDDLLNQFRAFYAGKLKTTLAELRRPYDLLILKVLSLLQDKDPSLAAALSASREAIWAILSDPVKFAAMS